MKYLLMSLALVAACKQGKGERCQVEADCDDGLTCDHSKMVCEDRATSGIDATVPPDAPTDAYVPDSPVDARPDAPPDTM